MPTDLFIYANGDSFVEGAELGDFLIHSYPGAYNFNEPYGEVKPHIKAWFDEIQTPGTELFELRQHLTKQIKREQQQRNFCAKLAGMMKAEFYNNGLGGAGMDRILRTTLTDLIEFKKTKKKILAIIGTTELLRMELPSSNDDSTLWEIYHPGNKISNSSVNSVLEYYYLRTKNYHKMVKFYQYVITLQDFCKANSIKLMWISGYAPIDQIIQVETELIMEKDLCALQDYASFKYAADMQQLAKIINYNVRLPGYHFSESVHDATAKQLYEQLDEL